MADSGIKDICVTDWDTLRFIWWEHERRTAENETLVGWELQLISTTYGAIYSNPLREWQATVNGTQYSGSVSVAIGNNETKTLARNFTTIKHNADGSKTFSYSFSQVFNITFSDVWIGTKSGSGTGVLNTIPRAAILKSAPLILDDETDSITITFENPAGNIVEEIAFCIGNINNKIVTPYDVITDKDGTTFTYPIGAERKKILRQFADKNTVPIRYFLRTIIGGVDSYTSIDAEFTIVNPKPVLNSTVKDVGSVSTTLTGNPTGIIIKGYNSIEYAFNATPQKEATIVSYNLTCGGTKINKDSTNKAYNVESGDFVFTVTDSRGNTTTKEINLTLIDYIKPTCSQSVEMALTGETSAKVNLSLEGNFFKGSFGSVTNALTLQYRYKEGGGSWGNWLNVSATPNYSNNTYSVSFDVTGLSYNKAYTFQSSAVDATGTTHRVETTEYTIRLVPVFDWGENDFNFNVPVTIQGNTINDYPIERGTASMGSNGTWYWEKWASGKAVCYGKRNFGNMGMSTAWGNMYESAAFTQSLPSGLFAAEPTTIQINIIKSGNGGGFVSQGWGNNATANSTGSFSIVSPVSISLSQVYLGFYVIGTWK